MTKLIAIKNAETGEEIVREMTDEELAEYALGTQARVDRLAAEEEAVNKKKAILQKLGITEAEAETLLS